METVTIGERGKRSVLLGVDWSVVVDKRLLQGRRLAHAASEAAERKESDTRQVAAAKRHHLLPAEAAGDGGKGTPEKLEYGWRRTCYLGAINQRMHFA
jgi:hypothetical protein